ncbi:MAG: hypothetical protein KGL54_11195 [Sphingomonadales bacterium]|nr:hypothetical protein [Sphingomonadales bacterium]
MTSSSGRRGLSVDRRPQLRLGRSLVAWAIANPLGWLAAVIVTALHNALRADPNVVMSSGLAMGGMFVIGCVLSYPLTLLIGLPVQAWLLRRGKVSLTAHLTAAALIGWPVGLLIAFANTSGTGSMQVRLANTVTSGTYALLFLLSGGLVFWLTRRPDRDPA